MTNPTPETFHDAGIPPVVICVAPNGARKTRSDHPALPVSADEIAREALACADAGASALHLHVRDAHGGHTLDTGRYREVMQALDDVLGNRLLVQVTTEAVGMYQPEQQRDLLRELRPQAASVALRELIPNADHEQASGDLPRIASGRNRLRPRPAKAGRGRQSDGRNWRVARVDGPAARWRGRCLRARAAVDPRIPSDSD